MDKQLDRLKTITLFHVGTPLVQTDISVVQVDTTMFRVDITHVQTAMTLGQMAMTVVWIGISVVRRTSPDSWHVTPLNSQTSHKRFIFPRCPTAHRTLNMAHIYV